MFNKKNKIKKKQPTFLKIQSIVFGRIQAFQGLLKKNLENHYHFINKKKKFKLKNSIYL
jgi:hypothetical protein